MSALTTVSAQDTKPTGGRSGGHATPVRAQVEVTNLLREFLANVDKVEMHDRFWADDLIYTGASGAVKTKTDILKSMREEEKPDPSKPAAGKDTYAAEDAVVRQFGDTAVLNFRLVQHTPDGKTNNYRNSGTFVKRNGQWQAVSWQATKVPETKEATK
jgi:hypothetical protein